MANIESYKAAFVSALQIDESILEDLEYQNVPSWDSVGHMSLISEIENAFGIMLDMDDIIDFSSYAAGMEILSRYGIVF